MSITKALAFAAAMGLLGAPLAFAGVPQLPASRVTSPVTGTSATGGVKTAVLGQLDAEIALLKREVEISKLHADLRKAQKGGGTQSSGQNQLEPPQLGSRGSNGAASETASVSSLQSLLGGSLPTVKQISGVGKRITAVLQYPDGSTVQVGAGSSLGPHMRVVSINVDSVLVRDHGQVVPLRFGAAAKPKGKQGQQ